MTSPLKSIAERIVRLEEERKAIADDIADLKAEAKSAGLDVTLLMKCVRLMLKAADKQRKELDQIELFDTYLMDVGLIADTRSDASKSDDVDDFDPETGEITEPVPGNPGTAESREEASVPPPATEAPAPKADASPPDGNETAAHYPLGNRERLGGDNLELPAYLRHAHKDCAVKERANG